MSEQGNEKIAAGPVCEKSPTGQHAFIDWRDVKRCGPDDCSHCGQLDSNDPLWNVDGTRKTTVVNVEAASPEVKANMDEWKVAPVAEWPTIVDTPASFPPGSGMPHQLDNLCAEMPILGELPPNAFPLTEATREHIGIPEECLRHVVVPIPTEQLREYFTNKDLFYVVKYTNSKLKGAQFLNYLTNLDVPCDVVFDGDVQFEEYSEIMLAYFNQTSIVKTAGLHVMAAEMLLMCKGLAHQETPYALPIAPELPHRFIADNMELVTRWVNFLDSSQVFGLASIKALDEHYKPKEKFEVIDDKDYVGPNIAVLYTLPHFIATYFSVPGAQYKLNYYKPQFEEYMFKNERFAKYFGHKNNAVNLMLTALAHGIVSQDDLTNSGTFKMGVFDPQHPAYSDERYGHKTVQS